MVGDRQSHSDRLTAVLPRIIYQSRQNRAQRRAFMSFHPNRPLQPVSPQGQHGHFLCPPRKRPTRKISKFPPPNGPFSKADAARPSDGRDPTARGAGRAAWEGARLGRPIWRSGALGPAPTIKVASFLKPHPRVPPFAHPPPLFTPLLFGRCPATRFSEVITTGFCSRFGCRTWDCVGFWIWFVVLRWIWLGSWWI